MITGSAWPIILSIRNNQSVSTLQVNNGKPRYWISSFGTNTSLSLGILNRNRGAVVGFKISNITVDRVDSAETTVNPTSTFTHNPSFLPTTVPSMPTAEPTVKSSNDPTVNPTTLPTETTIYSSSVNSTVNATRNISRELSYEAPANNPNQFG